MMEVTCEKLHLSCKKEHVLAFAQWPPFGNLPQGSAQVVEEHHSLPEFNIRLRMQNNAQTPGHHSPRGSMPLIGLERSTGPAFAACPLLPLATAHA
jgi:hypothetical protein